MEDKEKIENKTQTKSKIHKVTEIMEKIPEKLPAIEVGVESISTKLSRNSIVLKGMWAIMSGSLSKPPTEKRGK